jgi:hypothetical protein
MDKREAIAQMFTSRAKVLEQQARDSRYEEAMRAALVAMDGVWCVGLTGSNAAQFDKAREALRAALDDR